MKRWIHTEKQFIKCSVFCLTVSLWFCLLAYFSIKKNHHSRLKENQAKCNGNYCLICDVNAQGHASHRSSSGNWKCTDGLHCLYESINTIIIINIIIYLGRAVFHHYHLSLGRIIEAFRCWLHKNICDSLDNDVIKSAAAIIKYIHISMIYWEMCEHHDKDVRTYTWDEIIFYFAFGCHIITSVSKSSEKCHFGTFLTKIIFDKQCNGAACSIYYLFRNARYESCSNFCNIPFYICGSLTLLKCHVYIVYIHQHFN